MTSRDPILRVAGRRVSELLLWAGASLGVLSVVSALVAVSLGIVPLVFTSGSMSPEVPTGSLGLARTVPASELQVGDVVSVTGEDGSRVTHRIVATEKESNLVVLTLKGDTNPSPDKESYRVKEADRLFFSVPYVGRAVMTLTSPWGMFLGGLGAATLLFWAFRRPPPSGSDDDSETAKPQMTPTVNQKSRRDEGVRRRLGATLLTLSIPVLLVGTVNSGTTAYFTDDATVTTTGFATHKVRQPGPLTCTTNANKITVSTQRLVVEVPPLPDGTAQPPRTDYSYWATVYNEVGAVVASQEMSGSPATAAFTFASAPGAGTTYVIRVQSRIGTSATGWKSEEFRQQPFGRQDANLICAAAIHPELVFKQPTDGSAPTRAQILASCGAHGAASPAACGTATDSNGSVASIQYILRRRSWLGTSCWDGSSWIIFNGCGYRDAARNAAENRWSVPGGGDTYSTVFGPHTYTLTIKSTDNDGYVSESTITYKVS